MVAKIVTYLVTLGSEALKKFIPQIAAELLNMKSQATCELLFSQPRLKIASDEKHNLELTKKLLASYQLAQDPTSLRAILHSIIESNLSSPNIIRFIKDQVIKHIDRDLVLKLLASNNQELNELVFSNPTIKAKISVSDILYQSLVAKNSYLDVAVAKLAKLNPKESLALVTRIPDTATKSFSNFQQQLLIKIIQQAVLELGNCGLNLSGGAKEKYATTQQLNQLLIHTVELLPSSKVLEEILAFYAKQQLKLSDAALVQILTQASLNKIDFVLMQNLIIQLGQNEFSDLLGELAAKSDAFLFAYALEIRQLSPQELAHVFNQLEKINNHEILRKIGSLISDSYEKFNDAARRTIIVNINYLICSKANSKAVIGYKLLAQFAQQLNAKNLADLAYAAHMLKFKYAAPAIEYIINNATPTQLIAFSNNAELKEIMTEIMNNSNDLNLKQLINKLDSRLNNQIQQ